ncbi:MAG: two-component regulator propeller domain-containing protein, partial [Flavobacterium sp.]
MEGLPSQVIYDLYVSQAGRLYLGTEKGLFSFDGVRFSSYEFIDNLGFAVNSIQEDEHGVIWCKNFANQIFKLENGKLVQPDFIKKILQEEGNNLVDFYVNGQFVFLLTEYALFQLSPKKNPKILLQLKDRKSGDSFTAMAANATKDYLEVTSTHKHYLLHNNNVMKEVSIVKGQKETILFQNRLYFIVKGQKNEVHQLHGDSFNQTLYESSPLFYKLAEASS